MAPVWPNVFTNTVAAHLAPLHLWRVLNCKEPWCVALSFLSISLLIVIASTLLSVH